MPRNGPVQWGWNELEELLQCPVCLDVPGIGIIEQCRHGHHICRACKTRLDACPLCKSDFLGTRNFVLEEVIRHYDILKNTMQLTNVLKEPDSKTTQLQKNTSCPKRGHLQTPAADKGLYPCRYHDCDVRLPAARLLNHVRSIHKDALIEGFVDSTDSFTHIYQIQLKNKEPINHETFILFVSGIGLVYLGLELLQTGEMVAFVQMCLKYTHAQRFLANVEFFSDRCSFVYNTRLVSVRDNHKDMMDRRFCYVLNKKDLRNLRIEGKFFCKVTLSAFSNRFVDELTVPDVEKIKIASLKRSTLVRDAAKKKQASHVEQNGKKTKQEESTGNCVSLAPSTSSETVPGNVQRATKVAGRRRRKKEQLRYAFGHILSSCLDDDDM